MKKLLYILAISGVVAVSCAKELSITGEPQVDNLMLTATVSDGTLVFSSEENLSQIVNALSLHDEYELNILPATKADSPEDFVSLRQLLIDEGLKGLSPKELLIAQREGLIYEPIDSLIVDPYFCAVLNKDREIIINDKAYRFVKDGMLQTSVENKWAFDTVSEWDVADVKEIPDGETVMIGEYLKFIKIRYASLVEIHSDAELAFSGDELVINELSSGGSSSGGGAGDDYPAMCVPEIRYVDGVLYLADGTMIGEGNIRKIKYEQKESDASFLGRLWTSLWGTNVAAYNYFSDKERMVVNMFSQNCVVMYSMGMKVRMQKKRFGIWWRTNASEFRYGWSAMECIYEYQNDPFGNIPEFLNGLHRPQVPMNMTKKYPFSDEDIVLWNVPIVDYDFTTGDVNNVLNSALQSLLPLISSWVNDDPENNSNKKRGIFAVSDEMNKIYVVFPQGEEMATNTGKEKIEWDAQWFNGTYIFGFSMSNGSFGGASATIQPNVKVSINRGTVYAAVKYDGKWKGCVITTE